MLSLQPVAECHAPFVASMAMAMAMADPQLDVLIDASDAALSDPACRAKVGKAILFFSDGREVLRARGACSLPCRWRGLKCATCCGGGSPDLSVWRALLVS